ncbi:hypothetical protein M413DRAFT_17554 [Hebeloma cylindrosporum]|uniref:Nitrogen regulatory protein areA GATA-like domain-containing protein n=1 Tax=Hebeloma cylindrosporum TaxID=76867 RepID=A0A0C3CK26_HEBCY|nr:hypothetical protein M413DRAFT_17554 [Hebeloma cylindrosporum h7]
MANYVPVLLASTNTVPDDSSLVTLPRGQVDYLSHEWQEEDVWRSWRNMTRQKNEITNGIRLENASWRTWWKQRNNLKTVSPETLNWLKDCDVTWLYGPLHTAVEWTAPPKPSPVPDSVDSLNPASAHDRLDLSTSNVRPLPYKPILKHRSISDFLTSDLPPTSPIFSPVDSEEEQKATDIVSTRRKRPAITHTKSDTHITRWAHNRAFRKDSPPRINPPGFDSKTSTATGYFPPSTSLLSAYAPSGIRSSISQDSNSSTSASGGADKLPVQKKKHISFNIFVEQCIAIEKPKKNASGFFGPGNHDDDGLWIEGRSAYVDDDGYDEDDEDDEEYATGSQWESGYQPSHATRNSHSNSTIEEGEDEDEDDDGIIEMRSSSSASTYRQPKPTPKKQQRSQSKVSTASSSSSTSTSTTNSSASRSSTANTSSPSSPNSSLSPSRRGPAASRQSSKPSTSPGSTNYKNSLYRPSRRGGPPLIRTPSEQIHVTIAPIAPTILKTTGASWAEGFGDEGASDDGFGWSGNGWAWNGSGSSDKRSKSGSSFGGDGGYGGSNANGGGSFGTGRNGRAFHIATGMGGGDVSDTQASDGTPVELVYVPPFGSNYSLGLGEPDYPGEFGHDGYDEEEEDEEEVAQIGENVYHHSASVSGSVGFGGASVGSSTPIPIGSVPMVIIDPEAMEATTSGGSSSSSRTQTIRQNKSRSDVDEEDAYDFFGGADLGEDYYYTRRGRGYERERGGGSSPSTGGLTVNTGFGGGIYTERTSRENRDRGSDSRRTLGRGGGNAAPANGEERQSRSRSRSQSRTPSPAFLVSPPTDTVSVPSVEVIGNQTGRRRSSSSSSSSAPSSWITTTRSDMVPPTSSSSDLLSPPSRGRQPEVQVQCSNNQTQSRGRSSTRSSPSSSSWERGGSLGSSPIGSLSPDGGRVIASSVGTSGIDAVLGGAAVLAGGGRVDREREGKEREKEKQRGRERRGRDRTSGKVLSASEVESLGREDVVGVIAQSPSVCSATSSDSASNNTTIMGAPVGVPSSETEEEESMDAELRYLRRAEEEQRRRVHPTPSNSPVVGMMAPGRLFDDAHGTAASNTSSAGTTTPTATSTASSSTSTSIATPSPSPSPSPSTYTHTRTPSGISASQPNGTTATSSPAKLRPPPLIPSPSLPAKPSTSFTAVSLPHLAGIASPSSPTITTPISAEGSTIVGKAVDIVSSAGAFLGLWGGKEVEHHVAGQ